MENNIRNMRTLNAHEVNALMGFRRLTKSEQDEMLEFMEMLVAEKKKGSVDFKQLLFEVREMTFDYAKEA